MRHELRQHSDKEDTPKPMEYIFIQFVLNKMEERYDNEQAEAKLTASINDFYWSKKKYSTSTGPESKIEL